MNWVRRWKCVCCDQNVYYDDHVAVQSCGCGTYQIQITQQVLEDNYKPCAFAPVFQYLKEAKG